MTKEEILEKYKDDSIFWHGFPLSIEDVKIAMDEYAKQQMIQLIENISREPISCYSQKERGGDKQYFLGRDYVNNLITRIKES